MVLINILRMDIYLDSPPIHFGVMIRTFKEMLPLEEKKMARPRMITATRGSEKVL